MRGGLASLMDGTALEELIDRYNAAWNAHDVDAIGDMHTCRPPVFENHTTGDVNVGREADRRCDPRHLHRLPRPRSSRPAGGTSGTTSSCRSVRRAGHTLGQDANRPGMEVEPTGKSVEYRGMDVIPIADGLVARKDVYSDGVTLLRQLGLTCNLGAAKLRTCARGRSSVG